MSSGKNQKNNLRIDGMLSIVVFVCLILPPYSQLNAQGCSSVSNGQLAGTLTPAGSLQWQSNVLAGDYFEFDAEPCSTYYFSFCPAEGGTIPYDSQITINDSAGNANTGGYNDDYCTNRSYLGWTPATAATYRVLVTKYNCNYTGSGTGTLAYMAVANNTVTADYSITNDAFENGGCVTLTPASTDQTGCVWDVNTVMDFSQSFSYDFTVNLGSSDAGADGMCFVMQNDPSGLCTCGASGGSMGASGIQNSVVIEIDTYINSEDRDDGITNVLCTGGPGVDHLDVWLNGNINPAGGSCPGSPGARIVPAGVALMDGLVTYNIENGLDHTMRIVWTPGSPFGTLTATILDLSATVTYGTISYDFDPVTVFGSNTSYFGFTASTGAIVNDHSICFAPVLLPVELDAWSVFCTESGNPVLTWHTASEWNNSYFVVERSPDAHIFTEAGRIAGAGTSSSPVSYSWTDIETHLANPYYRLASVAADGRKTYSSVLLSNCHHASGKILIAETAPGFFQMTVPAGTEDGELVISNLAGCYAVLNPVSSGEQVYSFTVPFTASGLYLLQFRAANFYGSQKLVIH